MAEKKIKKPPFTLEQTWKYQLQMWKWMAENCKEGGYTANLKEIWMRKNNFFDCLNSCFFCQFDKKRGGNCNKCPGRLVSEDFSCMNSFYAYDFYPVKFYKKLVALNKIRKGKNEQDKNKRK